MDSARVKRVQATAAISTTRERTVDQVEAAAGELANDVVVNGAKLATLRRRPAHEGDTDGLWRDQLFHIARVTR